MAEFDYKQRPINVTQEKWDKIFGNHDQRSSVHKYSAPVFSPAVYFCHVCHSIHTFQVCDNTPAASLQYYVCGDCLNTDSFWGLKGKKFDVLVEGEWLNDFTTWDRDLVNEDLSIKLDIEDIQMIRYNMLQGEIT